VTSSGERVVLVDADDRELGTEEKLAAHRSGSLHRALSIFLFDRRGRVLLQQRALSKYHSGGLWANACCSHPRPGESVLAAASRRLREELGIACPLEPAFGFVYRAALGNGLIEHEYDHVLLGRFDGEPEPNPDEVAAWRWVEPALLAAELRDDPSRYCAWLPLAFAELERRGLAGAKAL
jgi:isopentenyl-diphosphate Delta-isomerase